MLNTTVVICFVLEPFYNTCDRNGILVWNENISSYRAPISVKRNRCLLDDTTPYKSSADFLSDLVVVVSVNGKSHLEELVGFLKLITRYKYLEKISTDESNSEKTIRVGQGAKNWSISEWKNIVFCNENRFFLMSDKLGHILRKAKESMRPEGLVYTSKHPESIMKWGCMSYQSTVNNFILCREPWVVTSICWCGEGSIAL